MNKLFDEANQRATESRKQKEESSALSFLMFAFLFNLFERKIEKKEPKRNKNELVKWRAQLHTKKKQ